jgi:hypothetical protein
MPLSTSNTFRQFTDTLGPVAMQYGHHAAGHASYPAACGSLEHLIYQICNLYPQAFAVVNDYIARAPAAPPLTEACGDINYDGGHPVTPPTSVGQKDLASVALQKDAPQNAATHTSDAMATPRGIALLESHFQTLDTALAEPSANQSEQPLKSDASSSGTSSLHASPAIDRDARVQTGPLGDADQNAAPAAGTIQSAHEPLPLPPLAARQAEQHAGVLIHASGSLELGPSSSAQPSESTSAAS